ncbi:MAG: hypothetical protein ACRELD_15995 [Longimicrobiales bacterium]
MSRRILVTLCLAFVSLASTRPAAAQSLFGTRGLGTPLAPVDARARALGGIGTGLLGIDPSLVNPADAAGALRRAVSAVLQPVDERVELDGASDRIASTTFPLIRVILPFAERWVATAGYGAFLDQSWGIVADRTEMIGGDEIDVRDVIRSTGGIAQLQAGVAYSLLPSLSLGLAGGLYTGEVQRRLTRSFPAEEATLPDFDSLRRWQYRGPLATLGARWDPLPELRAGAAVTWSGELNAEGRTALERDFTVDLPLQVSAGVSAYMGSDVLATVGGKWAGWSSAESTTLGWEPVGAVLAVGDAWEIGGGLEYAERGGTRDFPIRLGARYAQLPFLMNDAAPTEWSAGLGFGASLAQTDLGPGALFDVAIERGGRGDASSTLLAESYWRLTVSLMLFGR